MTRSRHRPGTGAGAPGRLARCVTVVVATRNRPDELLTTLGRLLEPPDPPGVVVVDNDSDAGAMAEVRRGFPDVTFLALPANMGAAARNIGARLAATPLVAFSDDDSWWDSGALAVAGDLMAGDPSIALIAARLLVGAEATIDPTSAMMAGGLLDERYRPSAGGRRGVTGFLACAAVVRRTAFLAVGGFEARYLIGGEEEPVALALADAGWKLVYAPEVVARHHPSAQRDTPRRRRLIARNHLLTTWVHYPAADALRRSAALLLDAGTEMSLWPALGEAAGSIPWTIGRRRPVARGVAAAFARPDGVAAPGLDQET